jgi:hypothetical protein
MKNHETLQSWPRFEPSPESHLSTNAFGPLELISWIEKRLPNIEKASPVLFLATRSFLSIRLKILCRCVMLCCVSIALASVNKFLYRYTTR